MPSEAASAVILMEQTEEVDQESGLNWIWPQFECHSGFSMTYCVFDDLILTFWLSEV